MLLDLCLKVKEVHTYEYFITEVCNHPDLLFPDGTQQCHLARGFTGAARSMKSDAWLNIGERGQGDLPGWLSVDLVSSLPSVLVYAWVRCGPLGVQGAWV